MARQKFFFFGPLLKKFAHHCFNGWMGQCCHIKCTSFTSKWEKCPTMGNDIQQHWNLGFNMLYTRGVYI